MSAGEASADDWIVDRYSAMSDALNKTGRPMLFAIVGWGVGDPWKGWGEKVGTILAR
jgi:alpha-galactosidase